MKKLLQVLPSLVSGGVERGTIDLAKFIKNEGWSSHVVSAGGRLEGDLESEGCVHHQINLNTKNPLKIIYNSVRLLRLIKKHQFDFVHVRSRSPAWSLYLVKAFISPPIITTFHGIHKAQNRLKKFYNKIMIGFDFVIFTSNYTYDHVRSTYSYKKNNYKIIHRGVDISEFSLNRVSPEMLRNFYEKYNIDKNKIKILLPGRLTDWKGHDIFIEAISLLKDIKNIEGIILGSSSGKEHYKKNLEKLIKQKSLENTIKFVEAQKDMPTAYASADLIINASKQPESFGRVIAEAQAMERIVIAANHGGAKEIIDHQITGFLFDVNSYESLANQIETAISLKHEHQNEIKKAARKKVEAFYSKSEMLAKTKNIYVMMDK